MGGVVSSSGRRAGASERSQRAEAVQAATAAAAERVRAGLHAPPAAPGPAPGPGPVIAPEPVPAPVLRPGLALATRSHLSQPHDFGLPLALGGAEAAESDTLVRSVAAAQLDRGAREFTKADLVAILAFIHRVPLRDGAAELLFRTLTVPELRARIRLSVYENAGRAPGEGEGEMISAAAAADPTPPRPSAPPLLEDDPAPETKPAPEKKAAPGTGSGPETETGSGAGRAGGEEKGVASPSE